MTATASVVVSDTNEFYFRCHTGYGTQRLQLRALCHGPCTFDVTIDDGVSPVTSNTVTVTPPDSASFENLQWRLASVAVDENTTYEGYVTVYQDTYLPVSVTLYEQRENFLNTADAHTINPEHLKNKGPIYDAAHSRMASVIQNLRDRNGKHLLTLVPDQQADRWTTTSATAVNMLDPSASTNVLASTPGFNFDLSYLAPKHSSTVNAVFAAHGGLDSAGSTGSVEIHNSSGQLAALGPFSSSAGWLSTTVALDPADPKCDIQFSSDGAIGLEVRSVCLYLQD